jgi:hypothetical protein
MTTSSAQVVIDDASAIVALVERFHSALANGDASAAMRMLAEDVPVDSIGTELIVLSRVADSWRIRAIAWTGPQRQAG